MEFDQITNFLFLYDILLKLDLTIVNLDSYNKFKITKFQQISYKIILSCDFLNPYGRLYVSIIIYI